MNSFRDAMGEGNDQRPTPPVPAEEVAPGPEDLTADGGFDEVEEAHFDEVGPPVVASRKNKRDRLFSGGPSHRKQFLVGFIVIVIAIAAVAAVIGSPKKAASSSTTTTTTTTTAKAALPLPTKKKAKAKPTKKAPSRAATPLPTTTTSTTTSGTKPSINHPGFNNVPSINHPNRNNAGLGLPTAQEASEAKYALKQAVDMVALNRNVGALIKTPAALECLIWDHSRYAIQVVIGRPRPFRGTKRGQVSMANGYQVGFVIVYTTAGRDGIPYLKTVHVPSGNYRYSDGAKTCTLPAAGRAQLNAPAPTG